MISYDRTCSLMYAGLPLVVSGVYSYDEADSEFEVEAVEITSDKESHDLYPLLESTDHLEGIALACKQQLDAEAHEAKYGDSDED